MKDLKQYRRALPIGWCAGQIPHDSHIALEFADIKASREVMRNMERNGRTNEEMYAWLGSQIESDQALIDQYWKERRDNINSFRLLGLSKDATSFQVFAAYHLAKAEFEDRHWHYKRFWQVTHDNPDKYDYALAYFFEVEVPIFDLSCLEEAYDELKNQIGSEEPPKRWWHNIF